MKTKAVKLALIGADCGIQTRACIDQPTVDEYAKDFLDGAKFPPIDVFTDGTSWYLVDGFHRVLAAKRAELKDILANVHDGTRLDAVLWALQKANRTNGMRRSNADKEHSIKVALAECPEASNSWIAEIVGVSHPTVAKYRPQVVNFTTCEPQKRKGKDGKTYTVPSPTPPEPQESPVPPTEDDELDVPHITTPTVGDQATPQSEAAVEQFLDGQAQEVAQLAAIREQESRPHGESVHVCDTYEEVNYVREVLTPFRIKTLNYLRKYPKEYPSAIAAIKTMAADLRSMEKEHNENKHNK